MLAVDRIHPAISENSGHLPEDVERLLGSPVKQWITGFERLLLSYGTTVEHWRFGSEYVPQIPDELRAMAVDLVGKPVITTPRVFNHGEVYTSGYIVANSNQLSKSHSESIAEGTESEDSFTLHIQSPPPDLDRRERLNIAAMNMIAGWRAGADRILFSMDRLGKGFDETWLAWTRIGNAITGRRFNGELYTTHTARCLVASGDDDLNIIAYTEHEDGYEEIDIPLGENTIHVASIDGRDWTVSNTTGVHRLTVNTTPMIIREADPRVVRMASSMSFDPRSLESVRGPQEVNFRIKNPYSHMIEGEIQFIAPENWSFEPKRMRVRLEPDTLSTLTTTVRWTRIPPLGHGSIGVRVLAEGIDRVDARVQVPYEITSSQLEVTGNWSMAADRDDAIVVTADIRNRGSLPITLDAKAIVSMVGREGSPRISNLIPGQSVTRRFVFEVDPSKLSGTFIRVSLQEVMGPLAVAIEIPVENQVTTSVMVSEE